MGIVGYLGAELDFLSLENGDCPAYFLTWCLSGHAHEVPRGLISKRSPKGTYFLFTAL